AESGAWRDYYLSAAKELREGPPPAFPNIASAAYLGAVPTEALFDALAVRYAPERVNAPGTVIQFGFPDRRETMSVELRESVMIPRLGREAESPAATLVIDRADFDRLVAREAEIGTLMQQGAMRIEGDPAALLAMFGALDQRSGQIAVVTP
ncbi:MAG: alkyl sulfatase C-terminal domain-containing protein, partial [Pacificimonas sp.]